MARKQVIRSSRKFDERPVTRNTASFAYGVFNDSPSSEVPNGGIYYLENMTNLGKSLETRAGTKEWGDYTTETPALQLPSKASGLTVFWTIDVISGYRIWDLDALEYQVDSTDLENFIMFEVDGYEYTERIVNVDEVNNKLSTIPVISIPVGLFPTISINEKINLLYYSEKYSRIVLQIGTTLYITSDSTATDLEVVNIIGVSEDVIKDGPSQAAEIEKYTIIFNAGGMYKIDMESRVPYYYKINKDGPATPIAHFMENPDNPFEPSDPNYKYGRKRVYSFTRLSKPGLVNRTMDDIDVEWESGGVIPIEDNTRDYGISWTENPINETYPNRFQSLSGAGTVPYATHYSVYATKNIHYEEGQMNLGNNPEDLIWEMDVPVQHQFKLKLVSTGTNHWDFTVEEGGPLNNYFGTISYSPNATEGIANTTSTTKAHISDMASDGMSGSIYTTYPPVTDITDPSVVFSVGAYFPFVLDITGDVLTIKQLYLYTQTISDMFFEGAYIRTNKGDLFITEVLTGTTYKIKFISDVFSGEVYGTSSVDSAPIGVRSTISDEQLDLRQIMMPMIGRFMRAVPNGNLGLLTPGFYFVAKSNDNIVSYGQLIEHFEYMMGQTNPSFQFFKINDDVITELRAFDTTAVVRCKSSTKAISTNNSSDSGNKDVGRYVKVLGTVIEVSNTIGSFGPGSAAYITGEQAYGTNTDRRVNKAEELVLTSEPALRSFNGLKYGENLLDGKLMNKIKELQPYYSTVYFPQWGFIIWGRK